MINKPSKIGCFLLLTLPLLGLLGCGMKVKQTQRLPPEQVLPLRTATLEELLDRLEQQAGAITSINAVTELVPTTGSAYSGVIEQYHDVRAFVLARRGQQAVPQPGEPDGTVDSGSPARQVRLIGQAPVLRKTVFDMVADEERFRIFIPSKNKFIVGPIQLRQRSDKPIENLRPQHLFDALFFEAPHPETRHLLEENEFGGLRYYAVSEIQFTPGRLRLARKWWFERTRLDLVRSQRFDEGGKLLADVHYANWRRDSAVPYPTQIELVRPQEDYRLKLVFKEFTLNEPLPPKAFLLEKPDGVEEVELKDAPAPEAVQ